MSGRKREVYGRLAVQLRTHERPAAAERLCPGAMGLYAFLVIQARGEGSAGETADAIAISSWGSATPKMLAYRRKQADALIAVGLVERRGDHLVVVKYGEHNDTPEVIAANREGARARKREERDRERTESNVTRDMGVTSGVTDASVTSSISISPSGSGSSLGSPEHPPGQPPPWFQAAAETADQAGAPSTAADRPSLWVRFQGSDRWRQGRRTQGDAAAWLISTIKGDRRRDSAATPRGGGPRGDRQPLGLAPHWLPTGSENDL